ncbi:MAG: class I SAM-dependent methyltransferase [Betaproteobacteria bacterium]
MNQSLTPPTYDPPAVLRWSRVAPQVTPWLHEEVARRMFERLEWIRHKPQAWTHWSPLLSGLAAHRQLGLWCAAPANMVETDPQRLALARRFFAPPWWLRWRRPALTWQQPAPQSQDLIWANMVLHTQIGPQALLAQWHRLLRANGYVMFSCLGPDTGLELRQLYQELGWPPAGAEFTDMHDWGDMLVASGFAEPVMDMERLTLTFETAEALLAELRQWGRNVHPGRFAALRARRWRAQLIAAIEQRWPRQADGRLRLTVELVYGHALKSAAGPKLAPLSTVSVDDMREMLQRDRPR